MIGVIGQGFVGTALTKGYTSFGVENIKTYDINGTGNCKTLEELVNQVKYIFICVPTPMINEKPDFSIVNNVCTDIDNIRNDSIIIIKSTVLPRLLTKLQKSLNSTLIMNPEWLTQRTANSDFIKPTRMVWGCDNSVILKEAIEELSLNYFDCPHYNMTLIGAAKAKYAINNFGSFKITYFNLLKEWCGDDFKQVRDTMLTSSWVNEQHTKVPGPDGKFGFGGACFPKDLNAMMLDFEDNNIEGHEILRKVFESNKVFRQKNIKSITDIAKDILFKIDISEAALGEGNNPKESIVNTEDLRKLVKYVLNK